MGGRRKRGRGGRRRPAETGGACFLRPGLPDGSIGKFIPITFHPRSATTIGPPFDMDPLDESVYREVSIPAGPHMKIRIVESDDAAPGRDGRASRRAGERRKRRKTGRGN